MTKVSIITMHNYPNYGSILQAFATQEKFREFTDDVEIIDYSGGRGIMSQNLLDYMLKGHSADYSGMRLNPLKDAIKLPLRLRRRSVYNSFARKYLNLTEDKYARSEDLARFPLHDGIYITGSDQVWNPFFIENMPFFLDFVPAGKRKVGYAVSFGNKVEDSLNSVEIDRIKKYIEQYEYISVREERGLKFLHEQLGYQDAIQLVDPTLAMPPGFWRRYASKPSIKYEYILLYKLGKEKSFESLAKGIAERTRLPLVRFCSQSFAQLAYGGRKRLFLPPVHDFISLIDNAKYVITDSFHGTALAMSLNTAPIVYREEYDGERISGLLRLIGHEDRYVKDCNDFSIADSPVDFLRVNETLGRERNRVDEFLSGIFNN